jgi:hypothetical protein
MFFRGGCLTAPHYSENAGRGHDRAERVDAKLAASNLNLYRVLFRFSPRR